MTFVNNDGGADRGEQQVQLRRLVQRLFAGEVGADAGKQQRGAGVATVIVAGDFNHCLPAQCWGASGPSAAKAPPPPTAPGAGSPSVYRGAWLPQHADVDWLLHVLECDGEFRVERVSGDEPTCEDGTVDHILHITKASGGSQCAVLASEHAPDPVCVHSDHTLRGAALSIACA